MRTIVLRFSDAELEGEAVSTVDEHNQLITQFGATWWGWWKKLHESYRADLLARVKNFSRTRGLRVGLVNRKGGERLFVARCVQCETGTGAPIPSPEPRLTPAYYAHDPFPAWFKFDWIGEVDRPEFEREFGEVPSLDPTMYAVVEDRGTLRLLPHKTWELTPLPTTGEGILHISDLHFGDGHGFPFRRGVAGASVDARPLSEELLDGINRCVDIPIGALVASGDFVSKGDANSYPIAGEFLDTVLRSLGLSREHCIVVPGNHDLWTVDVAHPTRTYEHEAPYRAFLEGFRHRSVQDLESIKRLRMPSGTDLVFLSLNSSRIRSDNLKEYGYVSRHRYEELLRYMTSSLRTDRSSGNVLVFVVLHHHLMPAIRVDAPEESRPVSLTLDAGELIEQFCKNGVGYALHGHQHTPFVGVASRVDLQGLGERRWSSSEGNLFVLSSGSTGAKWDWLPRDVGKNTFSVYTPREDRMEVQVFRFLPGERASLLWKGAVPLQNFYDIVPNGEL